MVNKKNKRLKVNFRLRTFLVFLSLSLLFWLLIKLSKTYTSDVLFNVSYKNLPIDKVVQNEPINQIEASIETTGFTLLSYKLRNRDIIFDVSNLAYKAEGKYYYLPNSHISVIKKQLNVETQIKRFAKDSILLKLGLNKKKKIPVILDVDIQFKLGYNYSDQLLIVPDSIEIIGPEEQLDTILNISTKRIELLNVSDQIEEEVSLATFNYHNITFSDTKVLLKGQVDKFTEGSLIVPFKIKNLPKNYSITTFPDEVKVMYQIGLSNFNKITAENLKVVCDLRESESNGLNYLIPKLVDKSLLITSVKIIPNKIEYLIEKK